MTDETGPHVGPVERASIGSTWSGIARAHPGLVLSSAYLAATGIGMMSSWTIYSRFGINVFHYAQLSDFILVAVRNPLATVAILFALPAVWVIMAADDWLARRVSWFKWIYGGARLRAVSRTPPALVFYLVLYAWAFSGLYSGWVSEGVRAGAIPRIEIQLASGTYLGADATRPFETGMLGATSAWIFLYDVAGGRATAVPVENVVSITPSF